MRIDHILTRGRAAFTGDAMEVRGNGEDATRRWISPADIIIFPADGAEGGGAEGRRFE